MKRLPIIAVFLLVACGGHEPSTAPTAVGLAFTRTGTGNDVFDVPASVKRVTIHGTFTGVSQNFIVWCNTQLLVNEILGTRGIGVSYNGTHQLASSGCAMRIENSTGVLWSIAQAQ